MNKLKLYTAFLLAGLLSGCSKNELGNEAAGDLIEPDLNPVTTLHFPVTSTPLPISENFGDGVFTNFDAADTLAFFNSPYKSLATNNPADTRKAFFYPTGGVPLDGSELPRGNRMWVTNIGGNSTLQFRDARFTIGQTLPSKTATDPKTSTTIASDTESWGELDLSRPYQISFCVLHASGGGLLQVYVDNNTSGQANSLHGGNSRIFNLAANSLAAGQRVVIKVPDLAADPNDELVGTTKSFLQFRCESGCSALVIDDLWIGYQGDTGTEPSGASCTTASNAVPPPVPTDLALTAGDTQINVSWAASAFPFATSYDVAYNTSNSTSGATVVNTTSASITLTGLTNGQPYFVFVRGKNTIGDSAYSNSASAIPTVPPVPPDPPTNLVLTPGNTQIAVSWTAGANASSYDVAYNMINDPDVADGATVINRTVTNATLTGLNNGTEYFVFVRSKNSVGESTDISDSAIPVAPSGIWVGEALDLYSNTSGTGTAPSGSIVVNTANAVTITATGGRSSADDDFRIFFANQQVTWPFTFTARMAAVSVTGGGALTVFNNNAQRFGTLIMENKNVIPNAGTIAPLSRLASLEYFVNGTALDPFLTGSRIQKLDIAAGNRSRSAVANLNTVAGPAALTPGDYLRIQVVQESPGRPRVIRFTSPDGVTYTQENSSAFVDSGTNGYPAAFYVGFYGAPGADDLTLEFDNVEITQP